MCHKVTNKNLIGGHPLCRTFINEKVIPPLIFAFDDFNHIFRTFLATAFQPEFYDLSNARFEKLHVIFNEPILKVFTGKVSIIGDNFIICDETIRHMVSCIRNCACNGQLY